MASKRSIPPPPVTTHPDMVRRQQQRTVEATFSPSSTVSLPHVSHGHRVSPSSGTHMRSPAHRPHHGGTSPAAHGAAFPQLPQWGREPGASVSDPRQGMLRQATPATVLSPVKRERSKSPIQRRARGVQPASPTASRAVPPPPVPPQHPAMAAIAASASLMPSPLHAVALVSARPGSPETLHRAHVSSPVRREASSPFEAVHRDQVGVVDSPLGGAAVMPRRRTPRSHHTSHSRPPTDRTGGASEGGGSHGGLHVGASARGMSPATSPSMHGARHGEARSSRARSPTSLARRAMSQSRATTPGVPESSSALQHGAIYEEAKLIPKEFVCPLTKLVMNDPVITFEGVVCVPIATRTEARC